MRNWVLLTHFLILFHVSWATAAEPVFPVGHFIESQNTPSLAEWQLDRVSEVLYKGKLKVWDQGMSGPYLTRDSTLELKKTASCWELREINAVSSTDRTYSLKTEAPLLFESKEKKENMTVYYRFLWIRSGQAWSQFFVELQECPDASSVCRPSLAQFYFMKQN